MEVTSNAINNNKKRKVDEAEQQKQAPSAHHHQDQSPQSIQSEKQEEGALFLPQAVYLQDARSLDPGFLRLMINMRCEQLLEGFPDNKLFITNRTVKICEVLQGLIDHNFSSVPVINKKGTSYGFVDLLDVVRYVVQHFGRERLENSENFWKLIKEEEIFRNKTVDDIMTRPLRTRLHPVTQGYSLFAAIEPLSREKALHRIAILDSDRKLLSIITDSQVVRFLWRHHDILGDKGRFRVNEMNCWLNRKEVISIKDTEEVISGFTKLAENEISGVAVVNEDGKLVDSLSLRDLKGISADARLFWRLFQTCHNFLTKVKHEYKDSRPRIVTCTPEATIVEILERMEKNSAHRVFVVDQDRKPLCVIALRDVIFEIINNV
jgi:CBS-domain-containing membrane protein